MHGQTTLKMSSISDLPPPPPPSPNKKTTTTTTLNTMMQEIANENAAGVRRICIRSDQPKIETEQWSKAICVWSDLLEILRPPAAISFAVSSIIFLGVFNFFFNFILEVTYNTHLQIHTHIIHSEPLYRYYTHSLFSITTTSAVLKQ